MTGGAGADNRSRRVTSPLAWTVLIALLAGCGTASPRTTTQAVNPSTGSESPVDKPDEAFYQSASVPDGLPPGSILRTQPLTAPDGIRAWAIVYASTDSDGKRIAVSGLIAAPTTPAPAGGRPIVAYAHGTTGLADACAPSQQGASDQELVSIAAPFLNAGDIVVATDYEGLGMPGPHPYVVGPSEGHTVLDSIRAARLMPDIGAGGSVGIIGHSQGGGAALWSAQLAPTYAPELDIRGVIAAAPAAELAQISEWLVGPESGQRAWINALLLGSAWQTVYGLPLDAIFDSANQERANALQSTCPFDISPPDTQPLLTSPASLPGWRDELTANTPGGAKSNAPILVLQGTADEQIPVDSTRAAVQRLCGAGDAVELRIIDGGSHSDSLFAQEQLDLARDWMADRFAGKSANHGCAG